MNKSNHNNNKCLSEFLKMTVKGRELPVGNMSLTKHVMGKTCGFDEGNADEDREPWVTLKTRLDKGRTVNTKRTGFGKDHQRALF